MNASSNCVLYLGTEDGLLVYRVDQSQSLKLVGRGLQGNAVRAIAVHPAQSDHAYIGCGLRGWGLYRTNDYGQQVEKVGFAEQWVWDVVHQPNDPKVIWVGTEPAMIYKSTDDGVSFTALNGIGQVPSRKSWRFFHPPFYSGHIHGIAFHPHNVQQVLAGVEQGALVYSLNGGESWQDTLAGYDLHRISYNPNNAAHVLAGAGEGLLESRDGGMTWHMVPVMKGKYVHGIAFDPFTPGRVYIYADDGDSPLYRSDDEGTVWLPVGKGLFAAKPSDNLALHPRLPDVLFYAADVTSRESIIYYSNDAGMTWSPISDRVPKVWRMKAASL
ncbi:hypothetical protein SD71_21370 [Cohnella kolymensis]|uniref:Sortilin N-terminal domain-containing protein n=1 Tax=Cohnella kolymensis TaxID=1590652 RepID=A0ABR5A0K3_9BACL|nr:hypothetical protein [Cohnella kolymensis]KIL34208.1 hypothetical protein SD71_21370 [Cohnella kolymensis]